LTGTAGQRGGFLLAAPIAQARDSSGILATRSKPPTKITFDRNAMALRARRKKTLHAITLSEAPMALKTPRARDRAGIGPTG